MRKTAASQGAARTAGTPLGSSSACRRSFSPPSSICPSPRCSRGFRTSEGGFSLAAVGSLLTDPYIQRLIRFTASQALASSALSTLIGVPLAYVLARMEFRGRRTLAALTMVPFVFQHYRGPRLPPDVRRKRLVQPSPALAHRERSAHPPLAMGDLARPRLETHRSSPVSPRPPGSRSIRGLRRAPGPFGANPLGVFTRCDASSSPPGHRERSGPSRSSTRS